MSCFLNPTAGLVRFEESSLQPWVKNFLLTILKLLYPWVRNKEKDTFSYWELQVFEFIKNKKPDIIHVHDLPALNLGVSLKQELNCPLVYDAHEIYPFQPGYDAVTKDKLYQAEKSMIKFADLVVVINQDQAEFMMAEYGSFSYSILTNATSYPHAYVKNKRYNLIRERLKLGDKTKLILFQGGVNRLRKIDYLIEAISLSTENVHLILMTWGAEIQDFKSMARALNVENRVHFIDPVPWEEVLFWAASADIGFLPYQALDLNTKLSSPNKMYEFILSETPMIASQDLINVRRVFEKEKVGLLWNLKKPRDYAEAINKLLKDEKLYDEFKKNLKICSDRYTWESLSKDFQIKYRELNC